MTEVVLDRAGILAIIRKLIAASVAQHMGMRGERNAGVLPGPRNELAHGRRSQWSFSFADEYELRTGISIS